MQCPAILCNTMQYHARPYNTEQNKEILSNAIKYYATGGQGPKSSSNISSIKIQFGFGNCNIIPHKMVIVGFSGH